MSVVYFNISCVNMIKIKTIVHKEVDTNLALEEDQILLISVDWQGMVGKIETNKRPKLLLLNFKRKI